MEESNKNPFYTHLLSNCFRTLYSKIQHICLLIVPELEYGLVLVDLDLGTAHEKLFEGAVVRAFMTKNHRRVVHDQKRRLV